MASPPPAGNGSYVSTVYTSSEGEFWQQNASPAANGNGSGYRITDVRYGDREEERQIKRDEAAAMAALGRQSVEPWSWGITAWNAIACLLCPGCIYCMFGALLCNVFAYIDYRNGDVEKKRKKVLCSIAWSTGSFIVAVIVAVVILVVLFVVYDARNWTTIPTIPGSDFTM